MRTTTSSEEIPRIPLGTRARSRVAGWWRGEFGAAARALDLLLAPAELVYNAAARGYHGAYSAGLLRAERVGVPVVSVGNLTVGGTGKTPVAGWLAGEVRRRGARPAVLHGGYGADEPALHRVWHPDIPVFAARDRVEAAHRAIADGATVLILDDGFQHRRLARDMDIVLIGAEQWSERRRLLPRGPWREPIVALGRADAVAVTRKTAGVERAATVADAVRVHAPGALGLRLGLRPGGWRRAGSDGRHGRPEGEVVAVASVAWPEGFVENAREAGARIAALAAAPDHHEYTTVELQRVRALAAGRPVVTTAKDAVKLRAFAEENELWVLEQDVVVEAGAAALMRQLEGLLS